eukprot:evm.model.NODE_28487_length_17561_cov_39.088264.4
MERHTFLQGLTWLVPYDEAYNHLEEDIDEDAPLPPQWPPTTYNWPPTGTAGAASEAMHLPRHHEQRRYRTLASRVILQDSSCCLHRGPNALFFAAERPQDDATQMSFQIAMVEMNPAAFRAIVQQHKQRRRQQLQREEHEKQRLRRMEHRREHPSAPADDESSCLLLPPNPSSSSSVSSSINTTGSGDGSNGWKDREGEEGPDEEDTKVEEYEDDDTVVPALFFRIDDHVYLVDHMAMETIVCPKGDPRTEAPPSSSTSSEPFSLPPYAAFKFPTVTLRFWLSRLSLSPLKATQPLVSAIDAISRGLSHRLWLPPSLDLSASTTFIKPTAAAAAAAGGRGGRVGVKSRGKEVGGAGGIEAVESFLRAVETLLLLHPSSSSSSSSPSSSSSSSLPSAVETPFLLQQAGRIFRKALVPLPQRMAAAEGNKRTRGLLEEEVTWRRRLDRLLMRMFPLRRSPPGGTGGAGKEREVEGDCIEDVEAATAALKAVVRERHAESFRVRTVRAPQGEEPQTQQQQQRRQQQQRQQQQQQLLQQHQEEVLPVGEQGRMGIEGGGGGGGGVGGGEGEGKGDWLRAR